jgi:hypothetical protein
MEKDNTSAAGAAPIAPVQAGPTATRGMKKLGKVIRRDDLLKLPARAWGEITVYDHLFIVPTRKKHDSGYSLIAIVGVMQDDKGVQRAEIAAHCDDINWSFPIKHPYDRIREGEHHCVLRTDCLYPSGIFRMWASGEHYFQGRFRVGRSLSSTDVALVIYPRGTGRNTATGEVIPMPRATEA